MRGAVALLLEASVAQLTEKLIGAGHLVDFSIVAPGVAEGRKIFPAS